MNVQNLYKNTKKKQTNSVQHELRTCEHNSPEKSISKIFSLVDTILIIPGGEFLDDFELKKFHEDFLNFLG